jgi:hypothetical protein
MASRKQLVALKHVTVGPALAGSPGSVYIVALIDRDVSTVAYAGADSHAITDHAIAIVVRMIRTPAIAWPVVILAPLHSSRHYPIEAPKLLDLRGSLFIKHKSLKSAYKWDGLQ